MITQREEYKSESSSSVRWFTKFLAPKTSIQFPKAVLHELQTQKHQQKLLMDAYGTICLLEKYHTLFASIKSTDGKKESKREGEKILHQSWHLVACLGKIAPSISRISRRKRWDHHHLPWILSPSWKWLGKPQLWSSQFSLDLTKDILDHESHEQKH